MKRFTGSIVLIFLFTALQSFVCVYNVALENPKTHKLRVEVHRTWEHHVRFYLNAAQQTAETADPAGEIQLQVEQTFSRIRRQASAEHLVPLVGLRITLDNSQTIAWIGETSDIAVSFPADSEGGSRVLSTDLPAGRNAVFVYQTQDGITCYIDLPLTRNTFQVTATIPQTLVSFLAERFPVRTDPTAYAAAPLDQRFQLDIPGARPILFSVTSPLGESRTERNFPVQYLFCLGFLLTLILCVVGRNRIPQSHPVLKLLSGVVLGGGVFYLFQILNCESIVFTGALSNPKIFAGSLPYFDIPGNLFLAALLLWWSASGLRTPESLSRMQSNLFRIIAALMLFAPIYSARFIVREIVLNSSIQWWPRLFIPRFDAVIILPLTAILVTGAAVRIAAWFWRSALGNSGGYIRRSTGPLLLFFIFFQALRYLSTASPKISDLVTLVIPALLLLFPKRNTRGISITFTLGCTLIILLPVMTPIAAETVRTTVSQNLQAWEEERDQLRIFALESNLLQLGHDSRLQKVLQDPETMRFPAFYLWEHSDLSAVTSQYGMEIWTRDKQLLDRFGINSDFETPSDTFFSRLIAQHGKPVTISAVPHRKTIQSDLSGGIALFVQEQLIGFLVIHLPGGPLSAVPKPPEWGSRAKLNVIELSDDAPLNQWVRDDSLRVYQYILPIREPNSTYNQALQVQIPVPDIISESAGYIRLGLLGLLLLIPGILSWVRNRIFTRRNRTTDGMTFRKQLMITFTIFAVLIPMIFAVILHRVFNNIQETQRRQQIRNIAVAARNKLNQRYLRKALLVRERILTLVAARNEIPSELSVASGTAWQLLDSSGAPVSGNGVPVSEPLPLDTIADVFYSGRAKCLFFSPARGALVAQVVLRVEKDIFPDHQYGTLIAEFPVHSSITHGLVDSPGISVDIYAGAHICAGNRMDLFRTGFLPPRLSAGVYHKTLESHETRIEFLKKTHKYRSLSVLRDSLDNGSGLLVLQFPSIPSVENATHSFDFILIVTVVILGFSLITATVMGNRLSKPIRALISGADRVSKGEFQTPVQVRSRGELRLLTNTFNRMMLDIQRQRRDLERRHQFIATLVDSLRSGIVATDNRHHITLVNPIACRLLDMPREHLTGKPLLDCLDHSDLVELTAHLRRFMEDKAASSLTTRVIRKGNIIHLHVSLERFFSREAIPEGMIIVLDDISSTVRSSKMEAYAEMARRVAHEIKNPLTPIQLSIEHLRQTYYDNAPQFDEIFRQCTDTILHEVHSLRTIAVEFSRFARLPQPQLRKENIDDIIRDVLGIFSVPGEGITLDYIPWKTPLFCRCDAEQIKRVLVNIVQNAIQAMPEGGKVTLRTFPENDMTAIRIEDTGSGMDAETLLRLYEPYFSTRKDGIGLGLVIAKATIDEHDGEIRVQSTPGKGSAFTILLPSESMNR